MTDRAELIEAGTQAVCDWDPDYDPTDEDTRAAVGVVIDAVEPMIRADEHRLAYAEGRIAEHERNTERLDEGWQALLADLRAAVQAMHDEAGQALLHAETHDEVTAASVGISVLDDVLSLFNGGDDE